jgi:hypothetical protein
VGAQVNAGLGVLNDGSVLNIGTNFEPANRFNFNDVLNGAFADNRVGTHPESGSVECHSLVENVLNIRGGPGDPLDAGGGTAER